MSTSDEPWLADLKNMERVVEIFETLGGKNEPLISNLVTPYRRWVRTDDIFLREAPFSASQKVPHRIFLFRDLLVIAKHKEASARQVFATAKPPPPKEDPAVLGEKRRSFRLSFARRRSANSSTVIEKRNSSLSVPTPPPLDIATKVKLTHVFPLIECTVKSISYNQSDNSWGTQITHICRVKDATNCVRTRVEKFEFWFPSKDARESLEQEIFSLVDEENELQDGKRTTSALSAGNEGERSWAKNRPKSISRRMKEDPSRSRAGSNESEETAGTNMQSLSLADLAQRYNVDFAQTPNLENTAKFEVEFGEGQMGFSLSSGEGIGVIVGKLAPDSFAEYGGCEIGDRLESVNGVEIDMNMTWQRAVEIIKAAGRPVTLSFVRNVQVQAQLQQNKEKLEATANSAVSSAQSTGQTSTSTDQPVVVTKRKWAANRANHRSQGLIHLSDLEQVYKAAAGREISGSIVRPDTDDASTGNNSDDDPDDGDDNASIRTYSKERRALSGKRVLETFASTCDYDEERTCVSVLNEILQTEISYVSDLRALVGDYVIPIRLKTKKRKCRDLETAALMCEHGMLKSSCNRESSESGPLIEGDDVRIIFMNVETLIKVNSELLNTIEAGLVSFDSEHDQDVSSGLKRLVGVFSSSFEKITPFFTMYALYCHQYTPACDRLKKIRSEDDAIDTYLREREAKSRQTSLRSLLIKPVQRICRYPLLFQELLKRVKAVVNVYPEEKRESIQKLVDEIQITAVAVEKIANDVNQKVQVQETIGSILTVFHELGGGCEPGDEVVKSTLMAPSRRYLRYEEVFFREAPFDKDPEPARLYFFNDLIILATQKENSSNNRTMKRASSSRVRTKSFGNLVAGFIPGGGQGGNNNSETSAEQVPWTYQAIRWLDLGPAAIHPIAKPDDAGYYGFKFKTIKRTTTLDDAQKDAPVPALVSKKSAKRITWGAGVKESPPVNTEVVRNTRVVTSIQKFEIWMSSKDKLQTLLSDIEDKINTLSVLQGNAVKGMNKFGQQKKARSWIQNRASKDNLGDSSEPNTNGLGRKSTAGSIDAKDALSMISRKYTKGEIS